MAMIKIGELRVASAKVLVGGAILHVIAGDLNTTIHRSTCPPTVSRTENAQQPQPSVHAPLAHTQRSLPPGDAFETSGAGTTSNKSMRSAMALKTHSKPDPDGIG